MDVKRYKAGTLKGELTTAEIRKLIRAHNKASSIKIPPKSSREDIVGILQKAGYVVNHEKAELRPAPKGKVQKLKVISQKTIEQELPKPKPLTEEQKKQRQQAKQKKAGEKAFLKAVIPEPPSVSKPSKGVKVGKPPPKPKEEEPKKEAPKKQEPKIDIMKEIIDDWGSDSNNVVIEQNLKKLKDGIVGLWDSNKKFINIDGIFQFDKKLFNTLFMKYSAQKVVDGLKSFMLYITDSDDEDRIGQSDFSKWFEIRDGRTQSQIRGKDLNQSTLNGLIKEWESKFGKKKEEPKKEAPKKNSKDEKQFEDGVRLVEQFIKNNKGWENKDYSKFKNKNQFYDSFNNYNDFKQGYNKLVRLFNRKIMLDKVEPLVNKYKKEIRVKMRSVYEKRKTK